VRFFFGPPRGASFPFLQGLAHLFTRLEFPLPSPSSGALRPFFCLLRTTFFPSSPRSWGFFSPQSDEGFFPLCPCPRKRVGQQRPFLQNFPFFCPFIVRKKFPPLDYPHLSRSFRRKSLFLSRSPFSPCSSPQPRVHPFPSPCWPAVVSPLSDLFFFPPSSQETSYAHASSLRFRAAVRFGATPFFSPPALSLRGRALPPRSRENAFNKGAPPSSAASFFLQPPYPSYPLSCA